MTHIVATLGLDEDVISELTFVTDDGLAKQIGKSHPYFKTIVKLATGEGNDEEILRVLAGGVPARIDAGDSDDVIETPEETEDDLWTEVPNHPNLYTYEGRYKVRDELPYRIAQEINTLLNLSSLVIRNGNKRRILELITIEMNEDAAIRNKLRMMWELELFVSDDRGRIICHKGNSLVNRVSTSGAILDSHTMHAENIEFLKVDDVDILIG